MLLEKLELPSFVKTTGKRGLHICVPIARGATHAESTRLAEHIATAIARVLPDRATVERSIPKRQGRLYIDYLQNGHGKTIAAAYTLRAVDGAPVSTPIRWSEVGPSLDPRAFNLRSIRARLDAHGDLFAGVLRGGPDIRPLLARLG
jgi:bifunctional non-homologous end joining protein LigD